MTPTSRALATVNLPLGRASAEAAKARTAAMVNFILKSKNLVVLDSELENEALETR
jgi:hypothetical protein